MDVDVYYLARLGTLVPTVLLNLNTPEVREIRDLHCAISYEEARRHSLVRDYGRVRAPEADRDRWRAATDAFVREAEAIDNEDRLARLARPGRRGAFTRLLFARRDERLRETYEQTREQLLVSTLAAYHRFRDQAADLTPYAAEAKEQERRAEAERERLFEEQLAAAREAVRPTASSGAVWAYELSEIGGRRYFEIYLTDLDALGGGTRSGLDEVRTSVTAEQVQAALSDERERHPDTVVRWSSRTSQALKEWHGSAVEGWYLLTGERVSPYPVRPPSSSPNPHRGPSSNYYGCGGGHGAGGHHGCGGF